MFKEAGAGVAFFGQYHPAFSWLPREVENGADDADEEKEEEEVRARSEGDGGGRVVGSSASTSTDATPGEQLRTRRERRKTQKGLRTKSCSTKATPSIRHLMMIGEGRARGRGRGGGGETPAFPGRGWARPGSSELEDATWQRQRWWDPIRGFSSIGFVLCEEEEGNETEDDLNSDEEEVEDCASQRRTRSTQEEGSCEEGGAGAGEDE